MKNYLEIKNLDYLKIDTQGAELEILKGIGNEIQRFSIDFQEIPKESQRKSLDCLMIFKFHMGSFGFLLNLIEIAKEIQ